MTQIPKDYIARRRSFPVGEISIGYFGVELDKVEDIPQAQRGYGGEDWKPSWLVIGRDSSVGDPVFLDTSDSEFPVFTAVHGQGDWDALPIAPSVEAFFAILERLRALSARRESPVALEQHPISEREAQGFLAFVGEFVDGETPFFWRQFVEDIA